MSIRVFISHSTWLKPELDEQLKAQVPAHSKLVNDLCVRLSQETEPEFQVVIDRTIPGSRHWREYLFEQMAECQAGIVFLNKQALDHSEWVDLEVTVLGYRAITEKNDFRLIIVPFGGVTEDLIAKKNAWRPIALSEIQVHVRGGLNENEPDEVNRVFESIVSTLRELKDESHDYDDPAPSGWLVDRLYHLLPSDHHVLKAIAIKLKFILNGDSAIADRRKIAHFLYEQGPLSIQKLVTCTTLPPQWNGAKVLEIIGTYWVNMSASIGILPCCNRENSSRIIAINGKEVGYTPHIYVRQICGEDIPWPVFSVVSSYNMIDQIRDKLVEYFQSRFKRRPGLLESNNSADIEEALNKFMSSPNEPPVFITFLQIGDMKNIVNEICERFRYIHIIICTGTNPSINQGIKQKILLDYSSKIQMLMPEFDLAQEAQVIQEYESAESRINQNE